jgi:hypothetical protein
MPQAIKTALYVKLTADQTAGSLYDSVGGRIYEAEGASETTLPLLVYEVTSTDTAQTMGNDEIVDAIVTITIWGHKSKGLAELGAIEGKLYSLLKSSDISPTGYDRGRVIASSRDVRLVVDDVVSSQSVYKVTATDFS